MSDEEKKAIEFLKNYQEYTILEENKSLNIVLDLVERLQNENEDLQKSVNQIYEDYQDVGLKMFLYSETLDKVKDFLNEKIHYKVSHKKGDELKNIMMKEIVRQLNMYKIEILKIIKEGEKHG